LGTPRFWLATAVIDFIGESGDEEWAEEIVI